MLALLSPAKSLDLESPLSTKKHTQPRMLEESEQLVDEMRTRTADEIAALMHVSDEIAELNVKRFREFSTPFTARNARPSLFMFDGDVYRGMAARDRFDARDLTEAQKTVRILSGLYGLLRPLDLMQAYRLEMGTSLVTDRGRSLYAWWGDRITDLVRADLDESPGSRVLVNLASDEYAKAVDLDALDCPVVAPRFEDQGPKGDWKVISFAAKKARGEMAAWLVQHRVRSAAKVKDFDAAGYRYEEAHSTPEVPVFRRTRG
ncbi:peroxide stress protein YaaA [Mariniluteicoccus endophyticus]